MYQGIINLIFRQGISQRKQEDLIKEIESWQGVLNVSRLKPDAKRDEIKRFYVIEVENGDEGKLAAEVIDKLKELNSVASVKLSDGHSIPADPRKDPSEDRRYRNGYRRR